jgi:uncharacterized protein (TIGR03067 family)
MIIKTVLAAASLSLLICAPFLRAQNTLPDQSSNPSDDLQGTWQGEELGNESGGTWTMTIMGTNFRVDGPGKREWYAATMTLAPNDSPKQLQLTFSESPEPDMVGRSSKLIYKIEGGTLTIVGNPPGVPYAPKDFNGDAHGRRFVFKRARQASTDSAAEVIRQSNKAIPGLGTLTDPNGDCQMTGDVTRLTISIPGTDHALVTEQKRMTAPRILQEVSGDFTAQVRISANYPQNTTTIVPGRLPFQGAGLLLWADSDTYIRLENAQLKFEREGETHHITYPSWELRFAGKPLRMGGTMDKMIDSADMTLRITRKGNTVTGAVSADGTEWHELDPVTVKLPETLQIGLVAGHNTTSPIEATFEKFVLTPLPKSDQ